MRYAQIRSMDISNGEGIGIALFVQGCHFHCKGCFQPETWNFTGGNEWTSEVEDTFIQLAAKPHISRISLLGGEPLCDENVEQIYNLIRHLRATYPTKKIWVYTGHTVENILVERDTHFGAMRYACIREIDYLVDGQFMLEQKDLRLKFRGSANQRIWTREKLKEFIKERK